MRGDLSQPDDRFNGFDLTKERADIVKLVMAPMLQQPRGFGSDLRRRRQAAPLIDLLAYSINDRGDVVLLFLS